MDEISQKSIKQKSISIFGSTGSIGQNTIEVLKDSLQSYEIIALTANSDFKTLAYQAKLLKPKYIVLSNKNYYKDLLNELDNIGFGNIKNVKILAGEEYLNKVAEIKCDMVVMAIIGLAALEPLINAIKSGSNIGLANKEALVSAGDLILQEAQRKKVTIIPIDSEHNAIFQIFNNSNHNNLKNITLTASGGPFYKKTLAELNNVTKKQALKHPKWKMGHKISIDSATMMNKALEMIEANRLFNLQEDKIKVLIHPESIIHGLVDYVDGSTLAMMSLPDMKVPIAYAISYPNRIKINYKELDLAHIGNLNFYNMDENRFESIKLARNVLKVGGNAPCIFNAANEVAVDRFLNDEVKFNDIIKITMEVLEKVKYDKISSFDEVTYYDMQARKIAQTISIRK